MIQTIFDTLQNIMIERDYFSGRKFRGEDKRLSELFLTIDTKLANTKEYSRIRNGKILQQHEQKKLNKNNIKYLLRSYIDNPPDGAIVVEDNKVVIEGLVYFSPEQKAAQLYGFGSDVNKFLKHFYGTHKIGTRRAAAIGVAMLRYENPIKVFTMSQTVEGLCGLLCQIGEQGLEKDFHIDKTFRRTYTITRNYALTPYGIKLKETKKETLNEPTIIKMVPKLAIA